ncbi:hypothetical protein FOS14_19570 [Skermania sp. ID1734]|uniref:hypothetical protein n=1 Tax=Skermania sp. ID1734 TaxID=2597516 RepID=UPI00117EBA63|nr:hypothetical protein [Skermania sp. ID1734]TSD94843.1 hypothetical protein FOS14_19570 [Skermania sp. ID1734]
MSEFDRDAARNALLDNASERERAVDRVLTSYEGVQKLLDDLAVAHAEHEAAIAEVAKFGYTAHVLKKAGIKPLSVPGLGGAPAPKRRAATTRRATASATVSEHATVRVPASVGVPASTRAAGGIDAE